MKPLSLPKDMVRKVIAGTVTQFSLPIDPQPDKRYQYPVFDDGKFVFSATLGYGNQYPPLYFNPHYSVGQVLWLAEKLIEWSEAGEVLNYPYYDIDKKPVVADRRYIDLYDGVRQSWCWKGHTRQSNHMPQWAARYFVKVTSVKVQRLGDMTTDEILAAGVTLELIESMLENSWGKLAIEDCCWFNGDVSCGNYCPTCGHKAVVKANKESDPDAYKDESKDEYDQEYILEGFGRETCDGHNSCSTCGIDLEYWLTECGLESELDHFEECLTFSYGTGEKYALFSMYESAIHSHGLNIDKWNEDKPDRIELLNRLLKLGMRILWDSKHGKKYPASENPRILTYGIELTERQEE